ncbi:MAG: RNA methyltransferase [Bacteroidota bacterium]
MISKSQIKFIRLLQQKKHRAESGLFIAEGDKLIKDLFHSEIKRIFLFAIKDFFVNAKSIIPSPDNKCIFEITPSELKKISALTTPNQVVGVFEIPKYQLNIDDLKNKLIIALEDICDPGNLGTIIRIANWFGISDVICSEKCVDVYNPKSIQATMGSIARVRVHYTDIEKFFMKIKTFLPVYAATLDGENIYSAKLFSSGIILIGNESKGISAQLLRHTTNKIFIPTFSANKPDSLNAASATAILCSEFRRRTIS